MIENTNLTTWQQNRLPEWDDFVKKEIIWRLQKINVGESFVVPLNRGQDPNGLSHLDLARDGSCGGAKIHPAYIQELHPDYKVEKVCQDPTSKTLITHLKITKLQ